MTKIIKEFIRGQEERRKQLFGAYQKVASGWFNEKGEWVASGRSLVAEGVGGLREIYWHALGMLDSTNKRILTILAKTGWSDACNLGYSRFIWDPATDSGPRPVRTNSLALRTLPKWKNESAKNGKYLMCPGVRLADNWKDKNNLHVEPLMQTWSKGDEVMIVPGPQAYVGLSRFVMKGQDAFARFTKNGLSEIKKLKVGELIGSDKTRGCFTVTPDGSKKLFKIQFKTRLNAIPVVMYNTNQFTRSRLKGATKTQFTVEFENPPRKDDKLKIWWMAQL